MNTKVENQFKPVNLPKTSFAMKANLAKLEPELIKYFEDQQIWKRIRAASKGRKKFILHDGPPYANGNLHLGHALNKILKDVVCRSQQKLGFDADYLPGWDCHGLPIEWKIEESYREKKIAKDQINIARFRNDCKNFAKKWVAIQKEQFIQLGVFGDFDNAYLTMDNKSQARIVEEIGKFLMNGSLYQDLKPVLWSVAERTALAEAEVEYKDIKSKSVFVAFDIVETKIEELTSAKIIIWTTTPWTIPANRMLAGNKDLAYVVVEIEEASIDSYLASTLAANNTAKSKIRIVLAKTLLEEVLKICRVTKHSIVAELKAEQLEGIVCCHPLSKLDKNYNYDIPLVFADFVDDKQGSGFVHIAPSHGQDDYILAKKNNIKAEMTLDDYGRYTDSIPLFTGIDVYDEAGGEGRANDIVIEHLEKSAALFGRKVFKHSYPHSWRSKTPLLFRVTPQWFIALDDKNQIRKKALRALKEVNFLPAAGYTRLKSMIELRPDWCVSRQRVWGVPLPIFINKKTKQPLKDQKVIDRIKNLFIKHSADAWFNMTNQELLGDNFDASNFEKSFDVVDVWFDSGCSHAFVLKDLMKYNDKADLYLEGSDQHRGWFHSSLLESAGTNNQAPYKAILTNGFVVDEKGHKLSKSAGNIDLELSQVVNRYGAEIVRLWAISSNYYGELRIGEKILNQQVDTYRRFRNSIRWLLGNVPDFYHKDLQANININELPTLEKYILHKLTKLNLEIKKLAHDYSLNTCLRLLFDFCNNDLSAFYFDIRKDCLYCDDIESEKRKKVIFTIAKIFNHLTLWLAPILPFTTQEAWLTAYPKDASNLHIKDYPSTNESFIDDESEKKWTKILDIRKNATILIEEARKNNLIKSSLEAKVLIKAQNLEQINCGLDLDEKTFAEILIVSDVEFIFDKKYSDEQIEIIKASGTKCPRCWQIKAEVANLGLCNRCNQLSKT